MFPPFRKNTVHLEKQMPKKEKEKKKVKRMQTWEFFILQNNKTETFEGKIKILSWQTLEFFTHSEVSQKEKNKYFVLMHI